MFSSFSKKSIEIYSNLRNNNTPLMKIILNLFDLFKEMMNKKIDVDYKDAFGKVHNEYVIENLNEKNIIKPKNIYS